MYFWFLCRYQFFCGLVLYRKFFFSTKNTLYRLPLGQWILHVSLLCLRNFPTIQFSFLCILSGTLIKFIRLGTAVINLLDKLKRFSTELNFLQSQKRTFCLQNIFMLFARVLWSVYQICRGSWKLQTGTFFYLFLIHSVFVYLEAINFVGTLILAISVESL